MKDTLKHVFRTMLECLRRGVTPYLMYMFCGMFALACLSFSEGSVLAFLLGISILMGVVLNADQSSFLASCPSWFLPWRISSADGK